MTYPIIRYKISRWTLFLWVGLLLVSQAQAQDNRATRVELATLLDNNEMLVHVAVPRGQTIESAIFNGDDATVTLQPEPVRLPTTRWVLLDSGEGMVNRSSVAQAALRRFLPNADAQTDTGLIIYAQSPTRYLPTGDDDDLAILLDNYSARVGQPGCVADALQALSELDRPLDRSRRVLIIGGELSRQGRCNQEGYVDVEAPVDMVVVNEDVSDTYLDIAERSGGIVFTANNRTLETRMNDVRTLWSQPVFQATGTFTDTAPERGTLSVTLSNDTQVTFDVELSDNRTPDTSDDQPQVSVLGGATALPTNTPLPPTATPPAPDAAVITDDAAGESSGDAADESSGAAPDATVTTDDVAGESSGAAPAAESTSPVQPTPEPPQTAEPAAIAAAQSTSVPTSIANNADDAADADNERVQPATEDGIDPILLIGGGLLGLGLAGLGVFVVVMRGNRSGGRGTSTFTGSRTSGQQTMIEPSQTVIASLNDDQNPQTVIDPGFNNDESDKPHSPEMDMYEAPIEDEDELDLTDVVGSDDLLEDDDKTEIFMADDLLVDIPLVGYLHVQGDDTQTYELRPPKVTLGRYESNDIVINDKKLSRHHLRFDVSVDGQVRAHLLTNNPIAHNGVLVQTGAEQPTDDAVQVYLDNGDTLKIAPGIVLEYERAEQTE